MLSPQSAAACYQLGLDLARGGDFCGAFAALEKAVELDPDHAGACKELARLSLDANEVRAFTNWCHEASRIDPGDPEPHFMLGEHLANKGRREEAAEALRMALALGGLPPDMEARALALLEA